MILKNENIVKEMISILEDLHKYVPTHQEEKEIEIPEEGIIIQQKTQVIHPVYLGGDQLTVARARAAKASRHSETQRPVD